MVEIPLTGCFADVTRKNLWKKHMKDPYLTFKHNRVISLMVCIPVYINCFVSCDIFQDKAFFAFIIIEVLCRNRVCSATGKGEYSIICAVRG